MSGEWALGGATESALVCLFAALLTPETVELENAPHCKRVEEALETLQFLGVKALWSNPNRISVNASSLRSHALSPNLTRNYPFSLLAFIALLARLEKAAYPFDPENFEHPQLLYEIIPVLEKMLKNKFRMRKEYWEAQGQFRAIEYCFKAVNPLGTWALMMAASLAKGTSTLRNIFESPETDTLTSLINSLGGKIKRLETGSLKVEGVETLQGAKMRLGFDRNEAAFAATAAVLTHGDIFIKNAPREELTSFLAKLQSFGGSYQVRREGLQVWLENGAKLAAQKLELGEEFAILSKWVQSLVVLATQAQGETKIILPFPLTRSLKFIGELKSLGAELEVSSDEQVIKIFGPTPLSGARFTLNNNRLLDPLLLAALCAKGETTLIKAGHLGENYEGILEKLKEAGAQVTQ